MRPLLRLRPVLRSRWIAYAASLISVALVTIVIGLVPGRVHIANISMLYLVAVLTVAVGFGSGPAVVASVAAFLAFDFFFVEPVHTLTVSDPEEWVALLLFLLTAIVTGHVAASQRRRAWEAEQREREAIVLYDVVRLMSEPDLGQALDAVAARLRQELQLAAVSIEIAQGEGHDVIRAIAGDPEALWLARASTVASSRLLKQGAAPTPIRRGAPGRWIGVVPPRPPSTARTIVSNRLYLVPVTVEGQRAGVIVLVRAPDGPGFTAADNRLLSAVAAQVGIALERLRLRREATEAEILRRTDELKSALLSAVSHDLRTPLATISAAADSLLQQDVDWSPEERAAFARDIAEEARRLGRLVDNLLDLSRIEGGKLHPQKAWHDLRGLVEEVLDRLRPVTARHRVTVEMPDDLPPLLLDYVEIAQVLSNLIENATKHTPPGTEITISGARIDGEVQVEVADRGPGLPPEALGRVFEPFYRLDGQGAQSRGSGLGLAVAKGLVEAHGGRMWAENRPGGGARFIFTLPIGEPGGASSSATEVAP
ncbi:Sensor histidine kinase ResE [bacterium HR24]|nr:Sensor histidine kinase ResE [bacterium HR24]